MITAYCTPTLSIVFQYDKTFDAYRGTEDIEAKYIAFTRTQKQCLNYGMIPYRWQYSIFGWVITITRKPRY